MAYYEVECPDPFRTDYNTALIIKSIAEMFGEEKDTKQLKLKDCMLDFDGGLGKKKKENDEGHLKKMMSSLLGFFHLHGIKNKLKKKNDDDLE